MKSLLERLIRLDQLIYRKGTRSPSTLARKVGISERSVFEYLRLMKEMGAAISYSRALASYYYTEEGRFLVAFIEGNRLLLPDINRYRDIDPFASERPNSASWNND